MQTRPSELRPEAQKERRNHGLLFKKGLSKGARFWRNINGTTFLKQNLSKSIAEKEKSSPSPLADESLVQRMGDALGSLQAQFDKASSFPSVYAGWMFRFLLKMLHNI
jgi:hypothetical protein